MSATACVLALLAGALPSTLGDRLAFDPSPGSRVEKTFTIEHGLALKEMQAGGQEASAILQQGFEVASQITLKVLDTYRAVGNGRPLVLQRLFKDAGLHADLTLADASDERRTEAWDAECPIEGISVVFTWIPEEKDYGRHFDEGESLEEYLGRLAEDLDFRALLPDREVAVGDSWDIQPAQLVGVFAPSGSVPLGFVKGGGWNFSRAMAAGVGGPLFEVFGGDLSGAGRAAWKETREENGVRLAVIGIAAELATSRDRTAAARAAMNSAELLEEQLIDQASVKWKVEGAGTLLWNLTAGRFESFEFAGHQEVGHEIAVRLGEESPTRESVKMTGSLKVGAKAVAKQK